MKKTIIFILALFISLTTLAQLEVKDGSFKEVPGFVNINPDPVYQTDDNDLPFAVIKVKTDNINDKQRRKLHFEGNAGTFIMLEYKVGEVWVYLTAKYADYLKISHPDLSSVEFHFPNDLQPKRGYEMLLINKSEPVVNGWASLTIITQPENGGSITLNGRSLNETTPYTNSMIPSGKYEITVSKDRYKTVTQTIEVVDGDSKIVEIVMSLDVANITLIADQYTEVYVDGEFKTEGTWNGELYSGNHEITYKKQRHHDAKQIIIVEGGIPKKYELNLEPICGVIIVDTEPSGATVYIDGKKYGVTPITINNVMIGRHELMIDKSGLGIISKTLFLEEDVPVKVKEILHDGQEITVKTGNTKADVYIDGQKVGISPITTVVSYGKHTVSAYTENKSAADFINITRECGPQEIDLILRKETLASYAKTGYRFITLNGAVNQYGDWSYGLTIGSIKKYGWFASVLSNFTFKGYNPDYECDGEFYVNGLYPDYTGKNYCTRLSIIGGFMINIAEPVSLKVGVGYGMRAKTYETISGYWVKNSSTSAHGVDFLIGLQGIFRGLVVSVDAVTTNFKIFEAKLGIGWGRKNK